jgi:hypothetical protein
VYLVLCCLHHYQSSTIRNPWNAQHIERPIAVNGKVEIHPMMYVALSYDHRIIDGREVSWFLVAVKEALETQWNAIRQQS